MTEGACLVALASLRSTFGGNQIDRVHKPSKHSYGRRRRYSRSPPGEDDSSTLRDPVLPGLRVRDSWSRRAVYRQELWARPERNRTDVRVDIAQFDRRVGAFPGWPTGLGGAES